MSLTLWLSLLLICCLGAMSPGPSLAVVLRHTLGGSRLHGFLTAIAHGVGIGLYAVICVTGLAILLQQSPQLFTAITWAGAAYLAWIGWQSLRSRGGLSSKLEQDAEPVPLSRAALDGLLVALLNPKIMVFFLALFSQFVGASAAGQWGNAIVVATVFTVDTLWYLLVVLFFSHSAVLAWIRSRALWLDRLIGAVLLGLAAKIVLTV